MNNTILKDRVLHFDGDSTVSVDVLKTLIREGLNTDALYVDEINEQVKQYNSVAQQKLSVKTKINLPEIEWNIPEEYKNMQLLSYLDSKLDEKTEGMTEEQWNIRADRLVTEFILYNHLNLTDILRVIIYVINKLEDEEQVWGVGRGSSVSSYILYLIGVHDVDSVKYELDISDFLRE